jgi:hypothetical protein
LNGTTSNVDHLCRTAGAGDFSADWDESECSQLIEVFKSKVSTGHQMKVAVGVPVSTPKTPAKKAKSTPSKRASTPSTGDSQKATPARKPVQSTAMKLTQTPSKPSSSKPGKTPSAAIRKEQAPSSARKSQSSGHGPENGLASDRHAEATTKPRVSSSTPEVGQKSKASAKKGKKTLQSEQGRKQADQA